MKKTCGLFILPVVLGCANVNIPNYIQDTYPYKQTFYASFDQVHAATTKALEDSGWRIAKESDPALFERNREIEDTTRKQTVLFTEIRQLSFFVGSGYTRLNAFLRVTADQATEVELRYLKITSATFKNFNDYRNDSLIDAIFKSIENNLK